MNQGKRIQREKRVVAKMIAIYCRDCHPEANPRADVDGNMLCSECSTLLRYALVRLERCPKGENKTSCRRCSTHCYSPLMRSQIRDVMRRVGPRMLFIHPWMALRHLWDERR